MKNNQNDVNTSQKEVGALHHLYNTPELQERFSRVETWMSQQRFVPILILGAKRTGFHVKVNGLNSFLPYQCMPWQYHHLKSWRAIGPSLAGWVVYGKITKIDKDTGMIFVSIADKVFEKPSLVFGKEYTGLVLEVKAFGVFIEIGHHFRWKYGTVKGLLPTSMLANHETLSDYKQGEEVRTHFFQDKGNGEPVLLCNVKEAIDWHHTRLSALVGQEVIAKVVRRSKSRGPIVQINKTYQGDLVVLAKMPPSKKQQTRIHNMLNALKQGETVLCKIIGYDFSRKMLTAKWKVGGHKEVLNHHALFELLDEESLLNLSTLKEVLQEDNFKNDETDRGQIFF